MDESRDVLQAQAFYLPLTADEKAQLRFWLEMIDGADDAGKEFGYSILVEEEFLGPMRAGFLLAHMDKWDAGFRFPEPEPQEEDDEEPPYEERTYSFDQVISWQKRAMDEQLAEIRNRYEQFTADEKTKFRAWLDEVDAISWDERTRGMRLCVSVYCEETHPMSLWTYREAVAAWEKGEAYAPDGVQP